MSFAKEKLNIGEHFIYNGTEFICLDDIYGDYLAMTAKPWHTMPFDVDNQNNWRTSSLRRVLNSEFLDLLDRDHLISQTADLTADNGDKKYGASEDYVTILSCSQYQKYRDLVPLFDEWMWTLTPWSCSTFNSDVVRGVAPTGDVYISNADNSRGVAPVCLFASENLKLCRQARLIGVDE